MKQIFCAITDQAVFAFLQSIIKSQGFIYKILPQISMMPPVFRKIPWFHKSKEIKRNAFTCVLKKNKEIKEDIKKFELINQYKL